MQDALCTLATGGGFASRKLFSDADENVIEVKRPVIINGISPVATRPDLIDRVVHIDLPRIDTYAREKELDAAFERDRPAISAGLFDLFSKALKELPGIEIEKPPRMADFGFLGEAIHRALDIEHRTFVDCYRENRADSLTRSIDTSPAALAVLDMMEKREKWSGTVKQLKAELDDYHKQYGEGWPQSPRGLADILRRMSPAMKESGVEVDFSARRRDGVHVTLKRTFFFEQYLESEKHVHKDHMFTQKELNGTKREEKDMKCEHVNMVNVFSGSKIMPEKKDAPKTDNHSEVVI
jgi:hypothetical protein